MSQGHPDIIPLDFWRRVGAGVSLFRELSKSGIVALVLISVSAGYFIGQSFEQDVELSRFLLTFFGVLFLASSSSALNQFQESKIDSEMPRTARRPIPSGRLTPSAVLLFVAATMALGLVLLAWVSSPVLVLGILAVLSYNGLYTLWWKKHWAYAAVPGAIPGALPILMGYAAAARAVWTPAGVYLFSILFFWQMPHFWVLALRYQKDYAQGGIPTLPVSRGSGITLQQITVWCLAYVGLALVAPFFLGVGIFYMAIAILVSAKVFWELALFLKAPESKRWLHFFLWVNFSLMIYLGAAAIDLWSVYLMIPYLTRN